MDSSDININAIKLEVQDEEWNSDSDSDSDHDVDVKPEIIQGIYDQNEMVEMDETVKSKSGQISSESLSNTATSTKNSKDKNVSQDVVSLNTSNRFHCPKCPKSYTRKFQLKTHILNFHTDEKDKPFQCEICLSENKCKKFIDETSLNDHKNKIHNGPPRFECKYCFKKLSCAIYLNAHYKDVHSELNPLKCDFCSMEFKIKTYLNAHLLAKHKDVAEECKKIKSHKCEICSKAFYFQRKLIRHVLDVHVVDKPFECQYCSKTFMKDIELAKHVKLHEVNTSFCCDMCPSRFNAKGSLNHHLKVKHGKFFYCSECSSSFAIKSEFDQHLQTVEEISVTTELLCEICNQCFNNQCFLNIHKKCHLQHETKRESTSTEENPLNQPDTDTGTKSQPKPTKGDSLQCDLCSMTFASSFHLVSHRKYAHSKSDWQCKVCLKAFKYRNKLLRHENTVHGTERLFKCDVCQSTFKSQENLTCHKRAHLEEKRRKCHICSKSFYNSAGLKSHMANYHKGEKPFKCHLCPKSWALNRQLQLHLISHSTEKSFTCDLCSNSFKCEQYLKTHYRKYHENPGKSKAPSTELCN